MIIGVGIDVVDVARFAQSLARTPRLARRLFTEAEQRLPAASLAARFAAKEALGEGARRAGRAALARRRGAPRRGRPPAPARCSGTVAARGRGARRPARPPLAEPRRRHRLGRRHRRGLTGATRRYDVATVRAAERPLLAALPDGALMARAAAGLAPVCARLLDGVYGARVVLLVGAGNNGGDALLRRRRGWRGAAPGSRRVLLGRPGARGGAGRAAPRPVAGSSPRRRHRRTSPRPTWSSTASSASAAAAALREPAAARRSPRCPTARRSSPSTCRAASTPTPARSTGAAVQRRRDRDLRRAQDRAARRPRRRARRGRRAGRHRARPAAGRTVEVLQADDVAALLPRPDRESDKYRRGVVGVAAGSAQYTGAAVLCAGGRARRRRRDGALRSAARPSRPHLVRSRVAARSVGRARAGCRPGRSGPGGGDDAAAPAARGALADDVPDGRRRRRADAAGASTRPARPAARRPLLTPHAGELARLLGVDRDDVEARRLQHARRAAARARAPSCCSRARPRWSPARTARGAGQPDRHPGAGHGRLRRRAGRAVRRAARGRARPVRRRLGRRLAARAGRPARLGRRRARSSRVRRARPRSRERSGGVLTPATRR